MSEVQDTLIVTVTTPQGFSSTVEAKSLHAKTVYGNLEILRNHAPLLALLKPGKVKIIPANNKKKPEYIYINGSGVIEVYRNKVEILADNGFFGRELNQEELERTKDELRKKIQGSTAEKISDALDQLNEVTEKLKIVEEIKDESQRS